MGFANKYATYGTEDNGFRGVNFRKLPQSLQMDECTDLSECSSRKTPRWADLFEVDCDECSIGAQEVQEMVPNAFMPVEAAMANPLLIHGDGATDETRGCLVEEKMIEIAGILGISMEGRIEEIRACIRGMIDKEFGCNQTFDNPKRKRKRRGPGRWLIWPHQ